MASVTVDAAGAGTNPTDNSLDKLPELPVSPHENFVTSRGLGQLQARLADAQFQLVHLSPGLTLERDYLERHVRWLQSRLNNAIPVTSRDGPRDRVAFGATVEILDADDRRSRYRIVGEDEADPDRGLISWVSPLARALSGKRVGDTVSWLRADGEVDVHVAGIEFGSDASSH